MLKKGILVIKMEALCVLLVLRRLLPEEAAQNIWNN